MSVEPKTRAEETLRQLAGAVNAARLYPPSSDLPMQAVERFLAAVNAEPEGRPVRLTVDPKGFALPDMGALAKGQPQVVGLAESLHALQAGQLVIAPGVTASEVEAFIGLVNSDARALRVRGGLRKALIEAGVERLAVIEVSLRASEERGIAGLDLTSAPLEDVGRETAAVAREWQRAATQGDGVDELAGALDSLEEATREIAESRVAEALLRLDEDSRVRLLSSALTPDLCGDRMTGMLRVIARMNPATLARLLRLVSERAGADPGRLLASLDLPAELVAELSRVLAPSALTEAECGVPPFMDVKGMVTEVEQEDRSGELERQVALAPPQLASGRALRTTVAIAAARPSIDAVSAVGRALPQAARDGALRDVREALHALEDLEAEPALSLAIQDARAALIDSDTLKAVCRAPITEADAAVAGEILRCAGPAGAEAGLCCYLEANGSTRSLLLPVIRGMTEPALAAASRYIRNAESPIAEAVTHALPDFGDRRAVSVATQALQHIDARVRKAAIAALAEMHGSEATAAMGKALSHWDPETQRFSAREIGRTGASEALPALIRVLDEIHLVERNHELKKEVIKSLEALGSQQAAPVLKRIANRRFLVGRKNKELRFLARNALARLQAAPKTRGDDVP